MSGPFGSSQWMYNPSAGFYGTEIDNSLRFNDNDSAYLSRTPASSGNQQIWTWSSWVKRANITLGSTNHQTLFSCATTNTQIRFHSSDDTLDVLFGGSASGHLRTSQVFRDVSAWFHVVVAVDTTQATASNRTKVYINGEQVTAFRTSTYPSQNYNTGINTTQTHNIARSAFDSNRWLDGYLAEINHIDGTALDASSFGETKSGIWIPKAYSGSYGTNGFHLEFAGNANDTSGNGNNFTAYNISAYDYVPDSPTNNFCTQNSLSNLNWLSQGASFTTEEGNLGFDVGTGGNMQDATFAMPSGKWYWEVRHFNYAMIGIHSIRAIPTGDLTYRYYGPTGQIRYIPYNSTSSTLLTTVASITTGDIVGVAFDADNRTISWYKNGSLLNTQTGLVDDVYVPCVGAAAVSSNGRINFGQDSTFAGATTAGGNTDDNGYGDFKYAPPSGFLALCSANLPAPAIDPAADASPTDYFDTILYTAATSNGTYTHGDLSFQPDFSWIKNRNNVEEHYLIDVVRDNTSVTNTFLRSNNTAAEGAGGVSGTTFSVTSTGYEFVETSINSGELYFNGRTYVGWNWKAGGTAVSNTDGSITSSVSANTDAGFSVVGWNPSTTSTGTVGHGLGVTPKLIIAKSRSVTSDWMVMHTDLASNLILNLNSTTAAFNPGYNHFNDTYPTSSVFSIGGYLGGSVQTGDKIAYCFADVDGFSKAGSYVGNGSSDGPFVYTGFRPAWVMIKRTDGASQWFMLDSARNTYNVMDSELRANQSNAESSSVDLIDFTSNGFKIRHNASSISINESGGSFVYLAFAEHPFKYANAR